MNPERYNRKLLSVRRHSCLVVTKNVDAISRGRLRAVRASVLTAGLISPGMASASSLYAPWQNGPPQTPTFFPLSVWYQSPTETGHSGPYPTIAAAAAATKMNIFLGLGPTWPESFGADAGELEAIKANNLYVVGGINTPWNEKTSPQSVASVLALAGAIGANANVIGYNAGDEANCGNGSIAEVPEIINGINGYDPTRIVTYNNTAWMSAPPNWYGQTCEQQMVAALQATSIGSFDLYPLTSPWMPQSGYIPQSEAKSNFLTVANDTLWFQGVTTQAMIHDGLSTQPAWVFVEAGGDNFGFSSANNVFAGGVTDGSATLTNASGWSSFTSTWVGLTVSGAGIPANTKITSIIDATHAVMSAAAGTTSANEPITVTGGAGGAGAQTDCVASANICVVNGNEYRPTPAQVAAEVWMSIISGANGIEYFCHDSLSYSFCLGDTNAGPGATVAQQNLTYINSVVDRFAERLNATTAGICSMQQIDYANGALSTTTSCSNGILTMATGDASVPGLALVKQYNGHTFLFAQSDRSSPAGATFTYTLTGLAGHTVEVIYDSDSRYDPAHTSKKTLFTLNDQAQFADLLGANGDNYQVKIYKIQ
jgi:hypothetical protein